MRLENTSDLSREDILAAVRFAKPANVSRFDIWVKGGREWRGVAYMDGHYDRKDTGRFRNRPKEKSTRQRYTKHTPYVIVVVRRGGDLKGRKYLKWDVGRKGRGYLGITCYTKLEALVYIVAHELRHLWQAKVKKGWRVWGARGQYSERDCDAYGISILRHYRRAGSPFYGPKGEVRKELV